MKAVGIGIIGCGLRIRELLNILPGLGSQVKVIALNDPRQDAVSDFMVQIAPDAKICKSYQELLNDSEVEWVMIGSWNCFHKDHIIDSFKAGKNVFCEKPLATTVNDCIAIKKAYLHYRRQFMIGFTLRYSPHYRRIKEIIKKGTIGEIISLEFNETLEFNHGGYIMADWRRLKRNAGTHLLEKCCHDIDIINWIVESRAKRVSSFGGLNFFKPENAFHIDRIGKNEEKQDAYCTWSPS
ncbi:MAG: Gfo/Idh/MocA family oxidoreductase, partial [Spirochaetota bacterium]